VLQEHGFRLVVAEKAVKKKKEQAHHLRNLPLSDTHRTPILHIDASLSIPDAQHDCGHKNPRLAFP